MRPKTLPCRPRMTVTLAGDTIRLLSDLSNAIGVPRARILDLAVAYMHSTWVAQGKPEYGTSETASTKLPPPPANPEEF